MEKETWADARLGRLLDHYNMKYWKNKLPKVRVQRNDDLDDALGMCYGSDKHIEINVAADRSDFGVRSTLLHEMCHLASGDAFKDNGGHDSRFFAQLEKLLRMQVPINLGHGENPNDSGFLAVPSKFRLCRAAMKKYTRRMDRGRVNLDSFNTCPNLQCNQRPHLAVPPCNPLE
jgi:hypothetical protein